MEVSELPVGRAVGGGGNDVPEPGVPEKAVPEEGDGGMRSWKVR